MQLLGEHHYITFQLDMQRKDEGLNACRFFAPAKWTPTVSRNFHSGAVCALEVAAGLTKPLPVLPTARSKACDIRSVAAASRLLFFASGTKSSGARKTHICFYFILRAVLQQPLYCFEL